MSKISEQWNACSGMHKQGFQDIYDPFYIQIKLGWIKNEIRRRKTLGIIEELEQLQTEKAQLEHRKALDDA